MGKMGGVPEHAIALVAIVYQVWSQISQAQKLHADRHGGHGFNKPLSELINKIRVPSWDWFY